MQNDNVVPLVKAKESTKSERDKELEAMGFVLDGDKVADLKPLMFAKYVLSKKRILYASGERFYFYDGTKWVRFLEKDFHRQLFEIIDETVPNQWKPSWESGYMTALARAAPKGEELNSDKQHINLQNGMFNINSFELLPHAPAFHSSVQVPITYDPNATCHRFFRFLNEVFDDDTHFIEVVQEMMGYCLSSETRAHKVFILEGVGSNGKSVLIEIIERLVGAENVSHVPMNDFSQPFARSEIVGKTLNVSTENEFDERGFNTQYIKSITSGDQIRVEVKHEKGFSYKPFCKLVFAMNQLPSVNDKSHGFFRRLVILPFHRVFSAKEADKKLIDKLIPELPGIFNFAIEGLKRLIENDFNFSNAEKIIEAILGYKSEQNPVIPFFREHIRQGNDNSDRLDCNEIFDAFRMWCRRTGEPAFLQGAERDRKKFWSAFRSASLEAGVPPKKQGISNGKRYLPGLKLIPIPSETETDDPILVAMSSTSPPRSKVPIARKQATVTDLSKPPVTNVKTQDLTPSYKESDTSEEGHQLNTSEDFTLEDDEDNHEDGSTEEFPCELLEEIDLQCEHSYLMQLEQGSNISFEDWQEEWAENPTFCQLTTKLVGRTKVIHSLNCKCRFRAAEYS
jgi:putative DNA primase/helicase